MDAGDAQSYGPLSRLAVRFTAWAERWIPDAFVFALAATSLVVVAGFFAAYSPPAASGSTLAAAAGAADTVVRSWGSGFWELVPFTMQMALIIVTGYVLATSPPVYWLVARLAALPRSGRGAVTMVAIFAMATSWFNWGFSLIFSAILAKETARRRPDADYRALAASSFLGLGSIWAQGLSGSAALQMATPNALQPKIREIVAHDGVVAGGIIPLTGTIFLWQSLVSVAVELAVVTLVVWLYVPPPSRARSAAQLGIDLGPPPGSRAQDDVPIAARPPGERLEHTRWLLLPVALLGVLALALDFGRAPSKVGAVTVNNINLAFLVLGAILHGTPARLMRAVREGVPATWGVVLQFPFYAGIAGVITHTHLNEHIASFFVRISTKATFPATIALYSAVLGVFVPSGGSKWVIEAPYVMAAAHDLKVHLGWMVAVYDLGEALANLVQPFWMLPTLSLLGLRARDVMGYTAIVFLVLLPVVLVLVTLLGATLPYPL